MALIKESRLFIFPASINILLQESPDPKGFLFLAFPHTYISSDDI